MSNNASNTNVLTNILQPRNKSLGLNLSAKQAISVPAIKSEFIIIPSTSQPNFGSYFIFDLKERCIISDIILNFNVTAITGRSGDATNFPHFNPTEIGRAHV